MKWSLRTLIREVADAKYETSVVGESYTCENRVNVERIFSNNIL